MRPLINACPEPVPIDTGVKLEGGRWVDSGTLSPEEKEYLLHCIAWLREEGLLRGNNPYVATFKGLKYFRAVPAILKD